MLPEILNAVGTSYLWQGTSRIVSLSVQLVGVVFAWMLQYATLFAKKQTEQACRAFAPRVTPIRTNTDTHELDKLRLKNEELKKQNQQLEDRLKALKGQYKVLEAFVKIIGSIVIKEKDQQKRIDELERNLIILSGEAAASQSRKQLSFSGDKT